MSKVLGKKGEKKGKNPGGQNSSRLPPALSIPQVFITSEDDSTPPPIHKEGFPMNMMPQGQGYTKDEDAASTAPLLDSGATTPLCEEPTVPYANMGTFLASSQKLKSEISSEEICLSSFEADKDLETCSKESEGENQLNLPDYPFVKWPWKYIRVISTLAAVLAIVACFSSSATLIAHLPQRCDPSTEWWQGKVFYEIFPASFNDADGDGTGDLRGITMKLDYLQKQLHVDALRLSSICEANNYPENYLDIINASKVDPHLGDVNELRVLLTDLEKRNMSLIIDIPVDRIPGVMGSSEVADRQHLLVENVLRFWLLQGIHGFYLKGLDTFVHQPDLWKSVAQWKTLVDSFSSKFSKRRVLVVSSDFIHQYSLQHPMLVRNVLNQVDLLDHNLNLERPARLEEQIRDGLIWDSDVDKPWIMWNVGTVGKSRLANSLEESNGCVFPLGVLMLALCLPGSASVLYGDELGLQSTTNSSISELESTSVMQWDSHCVDSSLESFGKLSEIRKDALPLHINAILKYDNDVVESRSHNYAFKMLPNNTVVIERFYPRRHRYLLILNLGIRNVTHDLSKTYFGGFTLVSSTGRKHGYVKLHELNLSPGEGLLLLLDK